MSYEEEQRTQNTTNNWNELMTAEEQLRGNYYAQQYRIRRAELDKYKDEWDYLQELYQCERAGNPDDLSYPNSFIPIITPAIEGQTASIMDTDIDYRHLTNNPAHRSAMKKLDAASDYNRKKSGFRQHMKDFTRYYSLLGNAWVYISWEKGYSKKKSNPGGYASIEIPPLLSVIVDGRIKDSKDYQNAEYIILERGYQSIAWAKKEYGEELGNAVSSGYQRLEGNDPDISFDDRYTFMLLEVWTRSNEQHNLQKIEMDTNGLFLRVSDPSKPYYLHVDNEYPFKMARMLPQLGKFYGVGDGAILRRIQETVNKLVDEVEVSARFSSQTRTVVDSDCQFAAEQFTSNPSDIAYCKDPRQNILQLPGTGLNQVVFNMIELLNREWQKAIRFNEAMTGNTQGSSATATQINTQMSQGSVGIKDKKHDIAEAMAGADEYSLKLCLEMWDKPFWASLGEDSSEMIDPESMSLMPTAIPTSSSSMESLIKQIKTNGYMENLPKLSEYETATDSFKNEILDALDFYTKVIIGEAIPKGRSDTYNMLMGLSQLSVINKEGQTEPLMSAERAREAFEDVLGMKLSTNKEEQGMANAQDLMMNQEALNQLNPVGQGGAIQAPTVTPPNLQQTVPQMPDGDPRRVQV